MILAPLFLFFAPPSQTAESIMARVAENQNRAEEMRSSYVYRQTVLVRLLRTNGKFAREELSEYTVTPTPAGIHKSRTAFHGKYAAHGKPVEYGTPGINIHVDIDGAIAGSFSEEDISNDAKNRDGIGHNMFPLTSREQNKYKFQLQGTEDYRDTPVYRITFEPKEAGEHGGADWAGEALIDRRELQPVVVTTHLAQKIPVLVRTLLGTNIEQLGFKVTYRKFDNGVWFPVTYGGEFRLRALFLYARRVGLSVQNTEFRRAEVTSKIGFAN